MLQELLDEREKGKDINDMIKQQVLHDDHHGMLLEEYNHSTTMVNVSSSYTNSKLKADESGISDDDFMASYMKERVEDIY